ncbi:class I SAM-dependent methyltransferase [Slackia heliotrinireducens]|uniref:class I SAM-dependent methyltransferase n=1 Tax=Slackia heliotrinireducens TaxID=84110 RepID=UPI003315DCDC
MIDFEAEWEAMQLARTKPGDADFWSKRSSTYENTDRQSAYADEFIAKARILPGETVFDIGCGTGTIACKLAARGHSVIAADFSEGMLDKLRENMQLHNVTSIEPMHMSWDDDWAQFGVYENAVDVAIASRSISVFNLEEALGKITRVARRRCCITLTTGCSPRVDPNLMRMLGLPSTSTYDYLYAIGILGTKGYEPTVEYIHSSRKDTFDTVEECFERYVDMIDHAYPNLPLVERQRAHERLRTLIDEHLVDNPAAGEPNAKGVPEGLLCLDMLRTLSWAFIAWDTDLKPM